MQVIVNNTLVNYITAGDSRKPAVLFLHGWGSSAKAWAGLMKVVSDAGFYAIAIDFPEPKEVWAVDNYVELVSDFLEKIKIKPLVVVGHSFGGRVMLKNQFDARGLIFIDTAGVKPKANHARNFVAKVGKVIIPKKLHGRFGSSDYKKLGSETMRKTFKNVINEDLTGYMPNIKLPTLLIWGEDDQETPMSDARIFNARISGSKLVAIKNAGHYAFLDQPAETEKAVLEFLKEMK